MIPKDKTNNKDPTQQQPKVSDQHIVQGDRQTNILKAPEAHGGEENNLTEPSRLQKIPLLHHPSDRDGTACATAEAKPW